MPGPKNIIVCSDGTGNTVNKNRGTNVFKLFEAVDHGGHLDSHELVRQIAIYDDGVGSEGFRVVRGFAGGVGWGLARNVRQLYRELSRVYRQGDRIYIFGFSRGAFTVRTLVGLIHDCGLIDPNSKSRPQLLPFLTPGGDVWLRFVSWRAWRTHRWKYRALLEAILFSWYKRGPEAVVTRFREKYGFSGDGAVGRPKIHFVGVWDTVGAVAVPSNFLRVFVNNFIYRFSFPNKKLPASVEKACHAIAIDEERHAFWPVLWDEPLVEVADDETGEVRRTVAAVGECECRFTLPAPSSRDSLSVSKERAAEPRVEQVWFPGVHSNVGGGYPKQGVSHVALDWMMAMAERHGLRFGQMRDQIRWQRNAHDLVYDSRRGLARYYVYWPRDLGKLTKKGHPEPQRADYLGGSLLGWPIWKAASLRYDQKTDAVLRVHAVVFDRIEASSDGYAPGPLPSDFQVVETPGEQRADLDEIRAKLAGAVEAPAIGWMRVRWFAQAFLYAATWIGLLYVLVRNDTGQLRDAIKIHYADMPTLVSTVWAADRPFVIVTVVVLSGLYAASWVARARIRARQASYWRKVMTHRPSQ